MIVSSLQLHRKLSKIHERLTDSEFFHFPPGKQLQMLCVYLEDQARLGQNEFLRCLRNLQYVSPIDLIKMDMEDNITGARTSIIDNTEATADAIDLNIRYIFWKHKSELDGTSFTDVSPYNLKSFAQIIVWANMRIALSELWQNIKYRDWRCCVRDGVAYYEPPDSRSYIREVASVNRYRLYQNEIYNALLASPLREKLLLFDQMISDIQIDVGDTPWDPRRLISSIRQLISLPSPFESLLLELVNRIYKTDIGDLRFGPAGTPVGGDDLLKACKYLFVLSSIYQNKSWQSVQIDDQSHYYRLVPVVSWDSLVELLAQTQDWPKDRSTNALNLLAFDPGTPKLDIWLQPLIPIGGKNYLLIPTVARNPNLFRLFESHMLQWGIRFDDRGKAFEEDIRNRLKALRVPVASRSIRFDAPDGKEIEYDVVAWFKGYLLLLEAKCLRTPYSPIDSHNCWKELSSAIEQVRRRVGMVSKVWRHIREQVDIDLPDLPPDEDRVLGLVVTNVFTFTGLDVDNIRICDFTCLDRYLSGPIIEAMVINKVGVVSRSVVQRIWASEEPAPLELWDYVHNPPGLKAIVDRVRLQPYPILPLDDSDKTVFFVPNVVIEGGKGSLLSGK